MTKKQLLETIRRVIRQELNEAATQKTKVVDNPNAGKYRIVSLKDPQSVLDKRFFDTEEEANKAIRDKKISAKIIKLPDTMSVYSFDEAGPATAPSKPQEKPGVKEPPVKSPGKKEPRRPLGNPKVKPKPKATMNEADMIAKIVKRFRAAKKNG